MTIKEIKTEWSKKTIYQGGSGKWQFTTYQLTRNGKCVIAVQNEDRDYGRTVVACISTLDGKDIFHNHHSRPCDNMNDAVDVASEIISEMYNNDEFTQEEIKFYGI